MSMKVAEKMLQVMKKVGYIVKDGKVAFGTTKYTYLSEEQITFTIRQAMVEVGLVMLPVDTKIIGGQDGSKLTTIEQTFRIQDTESDEHILVKTAGQGHDSADKGVAKAMTMAFKYCQRQAFMIPSGDDPDKICTDEIIHNEKTLQSQTTNSTTNVLTKQNANNSIKTIASLDAKLGFGNKHKEHTWGDVLKNDRQYIEYVMKNNVQGYGTAAEKLLTDNPI